MKITINVMMKMYFVVALFISLLYGLIILTKNSIKEVEPSEQKRAVNNSICVWGAFVWAMFWFFSSGFHGLGWNQKRHYMRIVCFFVATIGYVLLYHSLSEESIGSFHICVVFVVNGTFAFINFVMAWLGESESESGTLLARVAAKRARAIQEGEQDFKRLSLTKKGKIAVIMSIPVFFIYFIALFYIGVIFWMFRLYDRVEWKLFVTALAFIIKVAGNKFLLGLLKGFRGWVSDQTLYVYEFVTALRILTMSIPDEHTAQLVGLIGAVGEVCTRIFFFNLFLKTGIKKNKAGMSDDEAFNYALRGKLRVLDGSNDMIVEYVSSTISALLLIHLSPLGVFNFASDDSNISRSSILMICAYQVVPEFFLDFYVTFMESFCGLSKLHDNYWNIHSGSDKTSKIAADQVGDLPKALIVKLFEGASVFAFVLMASVK